MIKRDLPTIDQNAAMKFEEESDEEKGSKKSTGMSGLGCPMTGGIVMITGVLRLQVISVQ